MRQSISREVATARCQSHADVTISDAIRQVRAGRDIDRSAMATPTGGGLDATIGLEPGRGVGRDERRTLLHCFVVGSVWDAERVRRTRRRTVAAALALAAMSVAVFGAAPASAVPAPEVEYVYNVMVRRHFDFPNNDALAYGWGLCDKVTRGVPYPELMADTKRDVFPNDEQAATFVVSNAVGILCPAQIWALRNSAAWYRPPG